MNAVLRTQSSMYICCGSHPVRPLHDPGHHAKEHAMTNTYDLEQLKDLGAGRPAPVEVVRLYQQAFVDFGNSALWNWRHLEHPTITQALTIAASLKQKG